MDSEQGNVRVIYIFRRLLWRLAENSVGVGVRMECSRRVGKGDPLGDC